MYAFYSVVNLSEYIRLSSLQLNDESRRMLPEYLYIIILLIKSVFKTSVIYWWTLKIFYITHDFTNLNNDGVFPEQMKNITERVLCVFQDSVK